MISYNLTKFSEIQTVSYCPNITNENIEAPRSKRTCPKNMPIKQWGQKCNEGNWTVAGAWGTE